MRPRRRQAHIPASPRTEGTILGAVTFFETVIAALNATGVRYVIVGGVAVVLRGHARLTIDIDIVIDLAPDEAQRW